jgi:hypothetical protein
MKARATASDNTAANLEVFMIRELFWRPNALYSAPLQLWRTGSRRSRNIGLRSLVGKKAAGQTSDKSVYQDLTNWAA